MFIVANWKRALGKVFFSRYPHFSFISLIHNPLILRFVFFSLVHYIISPTSITLSITSGMFFFVFKFYYPLANEVARGYSNATVLPSVRHNPSEHSRINILQWILTKLGTYLVLKRIWNPIDFQGHRSRSPGEIFTA